MVGVTSRCGDTHISRDSETSLRARWLEPSLRRKTRVTGCKTLEVNVQDNDPQVYCQSCQIQYIYKVLCLYHAVLQNAFRAIVNFYRKHIDLACTQIPRDFLIWLVSETG